MPDLGAKSGVARGAPAHKENRGRGHMQDYPHLYSVSAGATFDSNVQLDSDGVESIESAPPVEFGGPGDRWSPESLLVASVADCFVLSFRAISRGHKVDWIDLKCSVDGTLERQDGKTLFTKFRVKATLQVDQETDLAKAERLLHKAEASCLITNSLSAESELEVAVVVV